MKSSADTVHHAAGTCKTGKVGDPMAVIDPQERVYGVTGLRVVNASVFPILPPGHPQATVCMHPRISWYSRIAGTDMS